MMAVLYMVFWDDHTEVQLTAFDFLSWQVSMNVPTSQPVSQHSLFVFPQTFPPALWHLASQVVPVQ